MKKLFIIIVSVIMTIGSAFAQNIFFPSKEGLVLLYANLNARGNIDGYTRQTISKVEGSGNNLSITYVSQMLDRNRRPTSDFEIPFTITINNGVVEWDMKNFVNITPETANFIEIEGDKLRIPSNLSPGDKLPDVNYIMTLNMGIRIRTEISITEQQCLAIEDITVPAGTFKCHKLTQTSAATVMRRTTNSKTISWYAPGIGTVKTESYDDRGRLQSTIELHAVE